MKRNQNTKPETETKAETMNTAETETKAETETETETKAEAETETEEETESRLMCGKAAMVGKTVALHHFEILGREGTSRNLTLLESVVYATNIGDNGKDNRDVADKAVRKEYPKAMVDYIGTKTVRLEMSFETFVCAALEEMSARAEAKAKAKAKAEDKPEAKAE